MVYLICFDRPYHHARHYIGYCDDKEESLKDRIARHKKGDGANILRVVSQAGIDFRVVRTWSGDRKLERQLKNRKKSRELCPCCSGERKAVDIDASSMAKRTRSIS